MVKLGTGRGLPRVVPVCHMHSKTWTKHCIQVDLDDPQKVAQVVTEHEHMPVVYAHAVCNVNKCEQNRDWAWGVNVDNFARFLDMLPKGRRLVYLSSDHVFGQGGDCDELTMPRPISVYGQSRVAAEKLALARPNSLVIRTSLALGGSHDGKSGHWNWLNHRLKRQLPVTIITDEARTTVWAPEAASRIIHLTHAHVNGMVHLANEFYVTRDHLARELCHIARLEPHLKYDQRASQTYPHLGEVQLVSRRHEGQLLINPLRQLRLHADLKLPIV